MKKTILALAVMLTTVLTSAFANKSEEINQRALASFGKDFVSAKNASWQQSADYAKVTFNLNNHVLFAYYNQDGELLAVVRNILTDQLPVNLLTTMKKKYKSYWVSELFEVATGEQTNYYVTLESGDEKIVLKSEGTDEWKLYSHEPKNCVAL